ncbi:MAG: trehalose-phosphatase [Proteobacteria bacterium SG_bin6]|nr:MAG: trehalose-phosphatase [Proteobacteria bacterium SG_bin6]
MRSPLPPPDPALLRGAALLLDVDGTLLELAPRPDAVVVPPSLPSLLACARDRLAGGVALISGRAAENVAALLPVPGITIAGSHGLELRAPDGSIARASRPAGLDAACAGLVAFAAERPGVLVEDKPIGVALHFRQAPDHGPAAEALAAALAERHNLHLQPGKAMIELRGREGDKGGALRQLMREPKRAATRPVFMGDDETDEPAHAAARALGGAGVLVGPPRATAARFGLADVPAVHRWLAAALATL